MVAKRITQKRTSMATRSKILKKILERLKNGLYPHMLYWHDRLKKEFAIKFVHMNNKEFKNADYLALFKDLDKLSNNYKQYLKSDNYYHECKVRCKSNLKKLCGKDNKKALTLKDVKGKSIQIRIYKLNDDGILCEDNPPGSGNMNVTSPVGPTPLGTDYSMVNGDGDARNATLIGLSSASPVGPTMLDMCYITGNRNEIVRNAIPQMDHFYAYEHEKQMGENVVTLPAMSIENTAMYGFRSVYNIEGNDKCESMGDSELLALKTSRDVTIQNVVTLPAKYAENTAMYDFRSGYNIEENNKCGFFEDLSDPKLQSTETNENIVEFQDADSETGKGSQLVPRSPMDFKEISFDPFSEYEMVDSINQPLQLDYDPLLSSTGIDLSSTNDWNDEFSSYTKGFYSFEKLSSIDVD